MTGFNRLWAPLLLGCLSLAYGCTTQPAPLTAPKSDGAGTSNSATAQGGPSSTASSSDAVTVGAGKVDLSVPRLPPKPLIWVDDWKGDSELPQERVNAEAIAQMADGMKSRQEHSNAARTYRTAISTDPSWPYPVYQAACNFELWGQHDKALAEFNKALELGFNDFPTLAGDDELGQIRERPEFTAQLQKVRERYLKEASKLVGQPIATRPKGAQPPAGWPVMLLLHGYGDTNLSYLDQATQWAEHGFLTVAVPGSVPAGEGFQWAHESADTTHADLQAILNSPLLKGVADLEQVYLLGFSQGALHGMVLTAENPKQYAGVVALSPGGSFSGKLSKPNLNRSQRPGKIYFTYGDQEPHAPLVAIWQQACQDAQWKFQSQSHPGGHHFPQDWDEVLHKVAQFLKN